MTRQPPMNAPMKASRRLFNQNLLKRAKILRKKKFGCVNIPRNQRHRKV